MKLFKEIVCKVPSILKTLFDEDLLDEEVLLEWGKKTSKKFICKSLSEEIHKKAEEKLQTFDELNFSSCVFFYRLREAEEESDDEGDIVLEFDERARISTLIVKVHKSVNILIKSQENFVFIG